MAAPSKTKKIESLSKMLQKRYKGVQTPPTDRTVLEHLIYAALLENTSFEQADSAMAVLEHYFIDWNEVRVSTVPELADTFSMLPDPMQAGERVRKTLQGVFEHTYMFDLEELRKKGKNLSASVEYLDSLAVCSRFMVEYTAQVAFGGHHIPLDEATLRIFRLLGLAQVNKDRTKEEVPGLERAIPKKNGAAFSAQLHSFAAAYYQNPDSEELREILKPVDADVLKRDWTAPALVVVKQSAPKPQPAEPTPKLMPFVAHDDDDFEEEHAGTEAEFIASPHDFLSESSSAAKSSETGKATSTKGPKKTKKEVDSPEQSDKAFEPVVKATSKETKTTKDIGTKKPASDKAKKPSAKKAKSDSPSETQPQSLETKELASKGTEQSEPALNEKVGGSQTKTSDKKETSSEPKKTKTEKPKSSKAKGTKTEKSEAPAGNSVPSNTASDAKNTKSATRQLREKKPK